MKLLTTGLLLIFTLLQPLCSLANSEQTTKRYSEFKKQEKNKYNKFKDEYLTRYAAYKAELREKWGIAELSSNSEYITYDDDKNIKVVVDFENDFVEINTQGRPKLEGRELKEYLFKILMSNLNFSPENVQRNNEEFNLASYNPEYSKRGLPSFSGHIEPRSLLSSLGIKDTEMLNEIVNNGELIAETDAFENIYQRTSKRLERQITQIEQFNRYDEIESVRNGQILEILNSEVDDLNERRESLRQKNIKSYLFPLKRDRFEKAHEYLGLVAKYSKKWEQQKELVLAIIETESHFNPSAKSHIPAYGLMQIVPSTAGADVNKKVFSIDLHPTALQLFDGEKNIEFGSAYLHILMNEYLTDIQDPISRIYCAIAAYNTGIGNLSKAFNNGRIGLKTAIANINKMSSEEVLSIISSKTHIETQRYIVKILDSQRYFAEHLGLMLTKL